jgi:hypothetical protein
MGIDIRDIGNIVPVLFHPERKWKLPGQIFAGPARFLHPVHRVGEQTVGTIETHGAAGYADGGVSLLMRGVDGIVGRPAVVGRPGQITALEEKIAGTIISNDEDDVALNVFLLGGELTEVNPAEPILRNLNLDRRLPIAFADIVFTHRRIGLDFAFERLKGTH